MLNVTTLVGFFHYQFFKDIMVGICSLNSEPNFCITSRLDGSWPGYNSPLRFFTNHPLTVVQRGIPLCHVTSPCITQKHTMMSSNTNLRREIVAFMANKPVPPKTLTNKVQGNISEGSPFLALHLLIEQKSFR